MRSATSRMRRPVGDRGAVPSIQSRQYWLRLLWLHLPQDGTRLAISEMNPVGRRLRTRGRRWSHSVDVSPQYAHLTSSGVIPRIESDSRISAAVGITTGITELTNAFVMLDFLWTIDCPRGIRNAAMITFWRTSSSGVVKACDLLSMRQPPLRYA